MSENNAYLVLNTGASSLSFSVFRGNRAADLEMAISGRIAGIGTGEPTFQAEDAQGRVLADGSLDHVHDRAALLSFLLGWLKPQLKGVTPAVSVGGLNAVVFSAGADDTATQVGARVVESLGVGRDTAASRISAAGSRAPVFVIPADQGRAIASDILSVLAQDALREAA